MNNETGQEITLGQRIGENLVSDAVGVVAASLNVTVYSGYEFFTTTDPLVAAHAKEILGFSGSISLACLGLVAIGDRIGNHFREQSLQAPVPFQQTPDQFAESATDNHYN